MASTQPCRGRVAGDPAEAAADVRGVEWGTGRGGEHQPCVDPVRRSQVSRFRPDGNVGADRGDCPVRRFECAPGPGGLGVTVAALSAIGGIAGQQGDIVLDRIGGSEPESASGPSGSSCCGSVRRAGCGSGSAEDCLSSTRYSSRCGTSWSMTARLMIEVLGGGHRRWVAPWCHARHARSQRRVRPTRTRSGC